MHEYVFQTGEEGAARLDIVESMFGDASRQQVYPLCNNPLFHDDAARAYVVVVHTGDRGSVGP